VGESSPLVPNTKAGAGLMMARLAEIIERLNAEAKRQSYGPGHKEEQPVRCGGMRGSRRTYWIWFQI
jgi:hypothetical protein